MKKSVKAKVLTTALIAGLSISNSVLAAPKEVHVHRPLNAWDYYKMNYEEDGSIRVEPRNETTFSTSKTSETVKTVPYLTVNDTLYGDDVKIDVDLSKDGASTWYKNIYKIEKVDTFTDNPNLNSGVAFELRDDKIYLMNDSAPIDRNGRQLINIYSTGYDAIKTEIHIKKKSPIIEVVAGYEPVTNADILFKLKDFSYATENPIEQVILNGRVLKGDCEEYHVVVSLIRLENKGLIKTAGNYTLTVKMNGYEDASYTFRVSENDGSYIPPEYVHPVSIKPSGDTNKASQPVIPKVDTVASASVATGGGSTSGGGSTGGSSGGGRVIPANLIFDFDLLANAQILKQLKMETEGSKKVLSYWYTSISDAATIDGETRIIDWNSFATAQAAEKAKGKFLTIEQYVNSPNAVDYVNRPYQVKYMLHDGLFGNIQTYESAKGLEAPVLKAMKVTKGDSITWDELDASWLSKISYVKIGHTYLTTDMITLNGNKIVLSTDALSLGKQEMKIVAYNYENVVVPITIEKNKVNPVIEGTPKAGEQLIISNITNDFMSHFRSIQLNGKNLYTKETLGGEGEYHIQGDKIVINGKLLKANQNYSITLSAYGYPDVIMNFQATEGTVIKDYTLPTIVTSNAVMTDKVELELENDTSFWRNSVTGIKVGFFTIDAKDFVISEHKITINNTSLLRSGVNEMVIKATEFVDLEFNLNIVQQAPKGLLRHADVNNGIRIQNKGEWLTGITKVSLNDVVVSKEDYTTDYSGIKMMPKDLNVGDEVKVTIESEGYATYEKTVQLKDLMDLFTGIKKDALTISIEGEVRPYTMVTLNGDYTEDWITSLTGFKMNGIDQDMKHLSIHEEKITISDGIIGDKEEYTFTLVSKGYEDTVVTYTEQKPTPVVKNPTPISVEYIYQNQDLTLSGSEWIKKITKISINGATIDLSKVVNDASNGRYYVEGTTFAQVGWVDIIIEADGYHILEDRFMVKEALAVPSDVKMHKDNSYETTKEVKIALPYFIFNNPDYDVYEVIVNGSTLAKEKIDTSGTTLTINGDVFNTEGQYNLVLKAKAYKDKAFNIPVIKAVQVELKDAPAVTLDTTDNMKGEDITLALVNDHGYSSAIKEIYIEDNRLGMFDYSVSANQLTLYAKHFQSAGDYEIRIIADGFKEQTVSQRIKKMAPRIETTLESKTVYLTTGSVYELEFTATGYDDDHEISLVAKQGGSIITPENSNQYKVSLGTGVYALSLSATNDENTMTEKQFEVIVKANTEISILDKEIGLKDNLGLDLENTYTSKIKKVYVNDEELSRGWTPSGIFTIYSSTFSELGLYRIKIEAEGYKDVTFNVNVTKQNVPSDVKIKDKDGARKGNDVVLNVIAFSDYKSNIQEIRVNGEVLASNLYSERFGDMTIKGSVFNEIKTYSITIISEGYQDFTDSIVISE